MEKKHRLWHNCMPARKMAPLDKLEEDFYSFSPLSFTIQFAASASIYEGLQCDAYWGHQPRSPIL